MEYKTYHININVGNNNLLMPVFVPKTLSQNEVSILETIKKYGIDFKENVTYKNGHLNGEIIDCLTIKRIYKTEYGKLELTTIFETNDDPNLPKWFIEEYKKFSGDRLEKRFIEKYEKPISRTSLQNGIYFSPQDNLTLEIKISINENQEITAAGLKERDSLYILPRVFFNRQSGSIKNPFVNNVNQYFIDNINKLPKKSPCSVKNTKDGVEIIEHVVKAYAQATG